jgi:hypothetical protein
MSGRAQRKTPDRPPPVNLYVLNDDLGRAWYAHVKTHARIRQRERCIGDDVIVETVRCYLPHRDRFRGAARRVVSPCGKFGLVLRCNPRGLTVITVFWHSLAAA